MQVASANGLPTTPRKTITIKLLFNNNQLAQQERIAEEFEMVRLASIFGGTSIY
jgi:hypothetical protein